MFNNNNGYSLADIAAATGNGGYGNNGGLFGGDSGIWLFVLFILVLAGGWGNNGWGCNNGGGNNTATYVTSDIQRGFDQSAVIGALNGINAAVNGGFANAEVSRCNSQANILQTLNNNQANLSTQLNTIAMNQQNCCCENRAGLADLKYTVATEACADRQAVTNALFDVTTAQTNSTQTILNAINTGIQSIRDDICQEQIDNLKAQNQQLQMQSYLASLAASQNAQTGTLLADNAAQTATLRQALNPTPVPAYIVGNPNGCNCGYNYNPCGCNNNGFYN